MDRLQVTLSNENARMAQDPPQIFEVAVVAKVIRGKAVPQGMWRASHSADACSPAKVGKVTLCIAYRERGAKPRAEHIRAGNVSKVEVESSSSFKADRHFPFLPAFAHRGNEQVFEIDITPAEC